MDYIGFETLSLLPVTENLNQCIISAVLKYFNDRCPNYLNEVFETVQHNSLRDCNWTRTQTR